MFTRQESAARARSAVVNCACTSFSASAKVADDTSRPTAGPVPKAGGAPGGSCVGSCASSFAWYCALPPVATAAPMRPSEVWVKKCLRDLDMGPPRSIVAESRGQKKWSPDPAERDDKGIVNSRRVTVLWLMMARDLDSWGKALNGQDGDTRQWKNN